MSVNQTELTENDRLVNTVLEMQRQMIDQKTRGQPIGADILKVIASGQGSVTFTAAPSSTTRGSFDFTPSKPILTLFNCLMTLYIDGTTSADAFPLGANLSAGGKANVAFSMTPDALNSNDTTGKRSFTYAVTNLDSVSHTYTLVCRVTYPIMPLL